MTIPPEFLDDLRARTTLSTLIGRKVVLKRAGREFKGCCPFHNEKTASFYVNDDKAFYHCFGCGAHGDAIRWMTDHDGLQFIDAVRELAAAAGMEVPAPDPRAAERAERNDKLHQVLARATDFYRHQLDANGIGDDARDFWLRRGIALPQYEAFGLGFAPSVPKGVKSPLREHLRDVSDDTLVEVGLMRRNDRGEIYDFFRNRAMIPIHDARGRVIGFGGRALGDSEPKYLNSPDTPLFDKGRTLFNLHRAAPAARRNGRLVIVEGYLDVLALARAGIAEAVAPNGTAITEAQLVLAWRQAPVPILCFDGDRAGYKAVARAAKLALPLIEPGKSLCFAFLPAGLDPDDLERQQGAAAVSDMLSRTGQLIDVLWRNELESMQGDGPDARAALRKRLESLCGRIRHRQLAEEYWREFSRLAREQFDRAGRRRHRTSSAQPRRGLVNAIEASVVTGLVRYFDVVEDHLEDVALLAIADQDCRSVIDALLEPVVQSRKLTADSVAASFEAAGIAGTVRTVAAAAQAPFSFVSGPVTDVARAELIETIRSMPRR